MAPFTSSVRGRTVVPRLWRPASSLETGHLKTHCRLGALRHDEGERGVQIQSGVTSDIWVERLDLVLPGRAGAAGIAGCHHVMGVVRRETVGEVGGRYRGRHTRTE